MAARLLVLSAVLIAGCRSLDVAARPVVLPPPSQISAIKVTPNRGEMDADGYRPTTIVSNPERIDQFVRFINDRGTGWKFPAYTFPAGSYTVSVMRGEDSIAVFWPQTGHIGGCETGGKNRLRPLSPDEWTQLQTILELEPSP